LNTSQTLQHQLTEVTVENAALKEKIRRHEEKVAQLQQDLEAMRYEKDEAEKAAARSSDAAVEQNSQLNVAIKELQSNLTASESKLHAAQKSHQMNESQVQILTVKLHESNSQLRAAHNEKTSIQSKVVRPKSAYPFRN
jgi:chromosome segregation ATPase